jgi:dolichol-phosphate mannosyltransferase
LVEISIIIPTYNESENVPILLKRLLEYLPTITESFEIIFVDDNSPDRTWEIVQKFAKKDSRILGIRRFSERSLSSAVLSGMAASRGKFLLVMDADLQHDEKVIGKMLKEVEKFPIVVGSRIVSGGSYGNWDWKRKIPSAISAYLSRKFLNLHLSEPLSGFFLIQRNVYETLAPSLNPRGFKILLEFIGRGRQFPVTEIGYTFQNRQFGKTKLSPSIVFDFLFSLLEIKWGFVFSITFLKYAFVGFMGVLVNLAGQWIGNKFLNMDYYNYKDGYLVPGLAVSLGFLLSVIHNFFVNNYWTFQDFAFRGKRLFLGFGKFLFVSVIGFLIQISLWRYLLEGFLIVFSNASFVVLGYISNFIGISVSTIWNYYLNKNFTWKRSFG